VSGRHNVGTVLHRKTVVIETQLVYQIIPSAVMRTLNNIQTKVSAVILWDYAKLIIATCSDVTGNQAASEWQFHFRRGLF
jgi:hypothetical protein